MQKVMKLYLDALQAGDYSRITSLFTENATIDSPLYGKIDATDFYRKLFKDTDFSKIIPLNFFVEGQTGAAHFRYEWQLANQKRTSFECVDIFEFNNDKIVHLTIIYDTKHTRSAFTK
jgi:ketosteroid isomerase-like protein